MVKIRLSRTGAKKRPYYHIIATDSRSRRDGRFLERLGYYNPNASGQEVGLKIDLERLKHWRDNGAQVTDRVEGLAKTAAKAEAPAA